MISFQISEQAFKRAIAEVLKELLPKPLPATPKLSYRLKEAAEATGMSVAWFRRMIRQKKIKTIKLDYSILIPASEIERIFTQETNSDECD